MLSDSKRTPTLEHVHLARVDGQNMILPPPSFQMQSLPFPRIPKSLTDSMVIIGEQFWCKYRHCLAMMTVLDCSSGRWDLLIPRQRATRDSSSWQPARDDFPDLAPTALVVGSCQVRVFARGEDPCDCCPPVDGAHLVLCPEVNDEGIVLSFLRVNGEVSPVSAIDIITDDLKETLHNAFSRIYMA